MGWSLNHPMCHISREKPGGSSAAADSSLPVSFPFTGQPFKAKGIYMNKSRFLPLPELLCLPQRFCVSDFGIFLSKQSPSSSPIVPLLLSPPRADDVPGWPETFSVAWNMISPGKALEHHSAFEICRPPDRAKLDSSLCAWLPTLASVLGWALLP